MYSEQIIESKKQDIENKIDVALITAYFAAGWQRSKKLPKLDSVLKKTKKKRKQPTQEPEKMLDTIKMIHAMCGGDN